MPLEFGAFNFVPKKTCGTVTIVPTYRNKWPQWTKFWFYHCVCTNSEVQEVEANGWGRASLLISTLAEWEGNRLLTFSKSTEEEACSGDAFSLTSWFQISHDLIEEWVALDRKPLQTYTQFLYVVHHGDYRGPSLDIEWPDRFPNDKDFVEFIKREAIKGSPYLDKEEEAKLGLTKVHKLCI